MVDVSGRGNTIVRQICSTALNQVPPEMVELDDKMVKVMVSLLQMPGGLLNGDAGSVVPEPSLHDLRPWSVHPALVTESAIDVQPCWINNVRQDLEVSTLGCFVCLLCTDDFLLDLAETENLLVVSP